MDASIQSQVHARLTANLEALVADGTFRSFKRVSAPSSLNAIFPALQLLIGPEAMIEEDTAGYVMEFPCDIYIMISDPKAPYALAVAMAAPVQAALESDLQLASLANSIRYNGDQPFTTEAEQPAGGTILLYTVQYRRKRADPTTGY